MRTRRTAGIPISNKILGRMIDPLGKPIDGKGEIGAKRYYPIERKAPAGAFSASPRKAVRAHTARGSLFRQDTGRDNCRRKLLF